MLKKWIAEGLVAMLAISSTSSLEGSAPPPHSGVGTVVQIEDNYRNGEYDIFLRDLHSEYEKAGRAGILRGLFETAKTAYNTPEGQESQKESKEEAEKLAQERNQRLLDAIAENPDLDIVQKVDSVVFHSMHKQQKQVLSELKELKLHIPETAEGTTENRISAVETEYYIKGLLLSLTTNLSTEKSIALQLEKFDKMRQIAEDNDDGIWKRKVEIARSAALKESAYNIDLDDLKALAFGDTTPQNPVEEKVKEIMMDYQTTHR